MNRWLARRAPSDDGVQRIMFRALAVIRVLMLLNAVTLYAWHAAAYRHPVAGWSAMGGLAAWTLLASWAYDRPERRTRWLLLADLSVSVLALLATLYVKDPGFRATLPGFFISASMLAWAVRWRVLGGVTAAVVLCTVDISIRDGLEQSDYGNLFLLLLGGLTVGFLSDLLQRLAGERDDALRTAAAAAERQRLARVVHDGVLQVLALMQRQGPELGPTGVELGRLAGEHEAQLRTLVQGHARHVVPSTGDDDLAARLSRLQRPQVAVSVPPVPVTLDAGLVHEVVAVVEAALSNVRHHVGPQAPAWVLLEDLGARWVVTVRDDGPGISPGRLEAAAREGRLGVSESIQGRMRDLGGEAVLTTAPGQGVEWELSGPRRRP